MAKETPPLLMILIFLDKFIVKKSIFAKQSIQFNNNEQCTKYLCSFDHYFIYIDQSFFFALNLG